MKSLLLLLGLCAAFSTSAQYNTKQKKGTSATYSDSLKNTEYEYILPILGSKARAKGFDLPLPHGIYVNTVYTKQNITLSNFKLGTNSEFLDYLLMKGLDVVEGEEGLLDLKEVINFGASTVEVASVQARVDTWILPFLNVSGTYGQYRNETSITLNDPLPEPVTAVTKSSGQYYGFGAMIAGGIGPLFVMADYNQMWTINNFLDKPARVRVTGVRVGHLIRNKKNYERSFSFWGGFMKQHLATKTEGQISIKELLPDSESDLIIKYQFDKGLERDWNALLGSQYQFSKHVQARAEFGWAPGKVSLVVSANYRFGIKKFKKNQ